MLSFDQVIDHVAKGKYQIFLIAIILAQPLGGALLQAGAVFIGKKTGRLIFNN